MTLYAGIDGGQTSSRVAVADERGRVVAEGAGAPLDLVGEPEGSRRRGDAIDALLASALATAGIVDARFAVIVAGLSGHDGFERPALRPRTVAQEWRFVHDTEIAHAGAFGGEPGLVVIAGTGSVALGIAGDGTRALVGGWGYLFGDEGSAYWIARAAIAAAMRAFDDARADAAPGSAADLGRRALEHFGCAHLRDVQHGVAGAAISRADVAGFASAVAECGREAPGSVAAALCARARGDLFELARRAHARLPAEPRRPVAFVGGVIDGLGIVPAAAELADAGMVRVAALEPPVRGALRLALAGTSAARA